MPPARPLAVLAAAVFAFFLGACDREVAPQLVSVAEMTPREVEVGDRIEIAGLGFPQGKAALVTFEGTLRRPGELPLEGSVVQTEGLVSGPQTIELAYTDALQALFCGSGDRERHTAFDGQVTVAFTAVAPGAPPISATLRDVSLDLRPPAPRAEIAEARGHEGERALAYAGIHVDSRPLPAGGLVVASVDPGSRAERAGVLAADRITRFEGVRVASLADAVPSGARAAVTLGVSRGASAREEVIEMPLDGFRTSAPRGLLAAACIIGLAAAALLLLGGPSPAIVGWLEDRLASAVRDGRLAILARGLAPAGTAPRRLWVHFGAALAVASAPLVAGDVDVAVAWLVEVSALVTLAIVVRRGALSRAARAARIATYAIARGAAIVAVVIAAGSVRFVDIARAQGGAPWGWNVFRTPVGWALFAAFVLPVLARPTADAGGAADDPSRGPALLLGDWAALVATAAVASVLFFGGWELPGMSPGEQNARAAYRLLGCAVFAGKSAAVFAGLVTLRAALPELRERSLLVVAWSALVPAALAAAAASFAWTTWGPGARGEALAGGVALALILLGAAVFARRVRAAGRAPRLHVNPFL